MANCSIDAYATDLALSALGKYYLLLGSQPAQFLQPLVDRRVARVLPMKFEIFGAHDFLSGWFVLEKGGSAGYMTGGYWNK
jgi:hypothetical protein